MKIAIVSYFAPPQPAVASHRVLRMTRVLQRAGHDVAWVTLDPAELPRRDEALSAVTPAEVEVFGLGGPNLVDRDARNLFEKVLRTVIFSLPDRFAVVDRHVEWSRRLRKQLPTIVRREGIDAVLLCCGPHGQLTAIPALRAACPDLRIMVDYRDLLSGNTWRQAASERLREKVQERERRWLSQVDVLFVNSVDAKAKFEATMGPIDGLSVEVMRNTADYELGDRIAALGPRPELGPGRHLGFFGTIFPRRRALPVLQAMARLEPEALEKLSLHLWCDATSSAQLLEEDLATLDERVRARVVRHDLIGFGEALRTMQAVDALVLINSPDQADQIFVPGKLYDYLMARRPILFVGGEGDARRIVAETSGPDWCYEHDEVDEIAERLRSIAAGRPHDVAESAQHRPDLSFAPLLEFLGSPQPAG